MGLQQIDEQIDDVLDLVITTPNADIEMTLQDYHEVMYPRAEDAKYVAVATKKDKWSQRMYKATAWLNHVDLTTNCYLSVNTFFKPQRRANSVRHLNAFFIDLDIYNVGVSQQDVFDAIDFYVKTNRMLPPTMVLSSGRGMYLIIKIEDVPGGLKRVKTLYEAIQTYFNDLFAEFGADPNAKDVSRVLRVPGSVNTKTGNKVEILQYNPEAMYTMSVMAPFVDAFEEKQKIYQKPKKKKEKQSNSKIGYLLNSYTLHKARSRDIETLCYLRDYDVEGMRNVILYIYHYFMLQIHHDEQVAFYKTLNLNDLFVEPLTEKEVKGYVTSSVRAYYENQDDRTKGYNFKNETLIQKLKITASEMTEMKTIINQRVKYDRNNKQRQKARRNDEGLTERQVSKEQLVKRVVELSTEGHKQKDIAIMLNISKGRVSQILKLNSKKV